MTGHGEGRLSRDGVSAAVELRSVNNRYFKLHFRASDGFAWLESPVEEVVRRKVRRGTVQANIRIDREASAEDYRLNPQVLLGLGRQFQAAIAGTSPAEHIPWGAILALPGVVVEKGLSADAVESHWPLVQETLEAALEQLERMRRDEGTAMADDLRQNCRLITAALGHIEQRSPVVVESYRAKLTEKLNKLLAEFGVRVQPTDVVREVGMFADRCDISEETVRLRSHLEQFDATLSLPESNGRKLDFLTQEMFRETNTIGSKASDAEIARHVVEIKTIIERVREMVQNVE
jgi:uncharacterized protein (TIGR00255 family)